eukprot:gene19236-biopygen14550
MWESAGTCGICGDLRGESAGIPADSRGFQDHQRHTVHGHPRHMHGTSTAHDVGLCRDLRESAGIRKSCPRTCHSPNPAVRAPPPSGQRAGPPIWKSWTSRSSMTISRLRQGTTMGWARRDTSQVSACRPEEAPPRPGARVPPTGRGRCMCDADGVADGNDNGHMVMVVAAIVAVLVGSGHGYGYGNGNGYGYGYGYGDGYDYGYGHGHGYGYGYGYGCGCGGGYDYGYGYGYTPVRSNPSPWKPGPRPQSKGGGYSDLAKSSKIRRASHAGVS